MLFFLIRVIARSQDADNQATEQQITTIQHLIEACTQFKYSRNMNIHEHLKNIYNIDIEQILTVSENEAKRIAATVYAVMFQQIQNCVVLGELNYAAKNLVERSLRYYFGD